MEKKSDHRRELILCNTADRMAFWRKIRELDGQARIIITSSTHAESEDEAAMQAAGVIFVNNFRIDKLLDIVTANLAF